MKIKIVPFTVHAALPYGAEITTKEIKIPIRWDEEIGEWLTTVRAHNLIDSTKHQMIHDMKMRAAWRHAESLIV